MVKKMEEIKEAISTSATSTPVKLALTSGDKMASGDALNEIDGESMQGSEEGERIRKVIINSFSKEIIRNFVV